MAGTNSGDQQDEGLFEEDKGEGVLLVKKGLPCWELTLPCAQPNSQPIG